MKTYKNGYNRIKMDENGWKRIKMDENEWKRTKKYTYHIGTFEKVGVYCTDKTHDNMLTGHATSAKTLVTGKKLKKWPYWHETESRRTILAIKKVHVPYRNIWKSRQLL